MHDADTVEKAIDDAAAPADVRERLVRLVIDILGSTPFPDQPFPVDQLLSELGVSSLKMVNLMLGVEVEFDVAIPQSDITPENFQCVTSIENLILKLRQSA